MTLTQKCDLADRTPRTRNYKSRVVAETERERRRDEPRCFVTAAVESRRQAGEAEDKEEQRLICNLEEVCRPVVKKDREKFFGCRVMVANQLRPWLSVMTVI